MEGEVNWAPIPKIRPADCPPGLECLISVDTVIIGFGKGNKHSVNNIRGQKLFYVLDGSNCCLRNFCCNCPSSLFQLLDHHGNELINFRRTRSCCCACCPVRSLPEMRVYSPPGEYLGRVKQVSGFPRRCYEVSDPAEQRVFKIKGPTCVHRAVAEYKVLQGEDVTVGRMSESWTGLDRILFNRQWLVGISFPLELDVRLKTVLISTCFLAYKKCL